MMTGITPVLFAILFYSIWCFKVTTCLLVGCIAVHMDKKLSLMNGSCRESEQTTIKEIILEGTKLSIVNDQTKDVQPQ